jgi:hypothetical protein
LDDGNFCAPCNLSSTEYPPPAAVKYAVMLGYLFAEMVAGSESAGHEADFSMLVREAIGCVLAGAAGTWS